MRARHFVGGGILAVAAALGTAGTAAAANPVVIEPDPVSPGSQFAIFDGGNCDDAGGTARFKSREHEGDDIPAVRLGSLRGLMGAVATVPEHARPGVYDVSIECTSVTRTKVTTTFTVHPGAPAKQEDTGAPKGPTHAGLGGSTGPNLPETLAGATLLTTAAAATILHLRHRRG